ncbi:MAG TPA: efflux transporter outer membrane subunit [Usitatibacter sp.]|nr:efflux transporter outer membrane subunit [Usitatibacter sp.]
MDTQALRHRLRWFPIFAGTIVLLLAGCATPPPIDPASLPATPAAFREEAPRFKVVSATPPADGRWWSAFHDPVLDGLVERADRGNGSIRVAAARLAQSRALLLQADAERLPQLDAGASVQRGDGLTVTNLPAGHALTLYTLGASVSWEADLFGKLRRAAEAAALDAHASEALLADTRLVIEADVAQSYLALRSLDEERRLVRATAETYRGTLELTERRYRAGDVAELDVARATTQVAATEADALALDRRRAQLEHAIAVLVGEGPSTFSIAEAPWSATLPAIPAGLPAEVLARRPDVAAAQATMLAAQARVGVAKAAWFPDIVLTGAGGVASPQLSDLLRYSARAWSLGALASLPIFDGGRREAGVRFASGEMDAAVAQYRDRVLVAFRDVEDQLSALRLLQEQAEAEERAVRAAARATTLSDRRWREGLVSQLELLDAQRSELADRRAAVEVKSAQYQATVGLVRALGGGWESRS